MRELLTTAAELVPAYTRKKTSTTVAVHKATAKLLQATHVLEGALLAHAQVSLLATTLLTLLPPAAQGGATPPVAGAGQPALINAAPPAQQTPPQGAVPGAWPLAQPIVHQLPAAQQSDQHRPSHWCHIKTVLKEKITSVLFAHPLFVMYQVLANVA